MHRTSGKYPNSRDPCKGKPVKIAEKQAVCVRTRVLRNRRLQVRALPGVVTLDRPRERICRAATLRRRGRDGPRNPVGLPDFTGHREVADATRHAQNPLVPAAQTHRPSRRHPLGTRPLFRHPRHSGNPTEVRAHRRRVARQRQVAPPAARPGPDRQGPPRFVSRIRAPITSRTARPRASSTESSARWRGTSRAPGRSKAQATTSSEPAGRVLASGGEVRRSGVTPFMPSAKRSFVSQPSFTVNGFTPRKMGDPGTS
jgi:hypothetical protein